MGLERVVADRLGLNVHFALTDVSALGRLCEVREELYVISSDRLRTLRGMERVHTVGNLRIQHNDELRSLDGLSGLRTVEGDLVIKNNRKLPQVHVDFFVARLTVGGDVEVVDNGGAITHFAPGPQ